MQEAEEAANNIVRIEAMLDARVLDSLENTGVRMIFGI